MSVRHVPNHPIDLALCGDVMTGRGIDQAMPYPANPVLYESYVRDARQYIGLAETVNGPIALPMDFRHIWGDALGKMLAADLRIINLETSITVSEDAWPAKGIHYRMHPQNVGCLTAARVDCCCLANNHVLDFGYAGLRETLLTLERAGIARAGAGANAAEAAAPAVLPVPGKRRVLAFSMGSTDSGIPQEWAAAMDRPGVNLLPDLSDQTARRLASHMRHLRQPGDVVVASIHWGGNWGYSIPEEQIRFAHRLIEEGVDLVFGHSSHHPKAIEVHQNCLVLYGSGDFVDDYEGITGYEGYRDDLRLLYRVRVGPQPDRKRSPGRERSGLHEARLVPLQVRRFRLNRATEADARWLRDLLNRLGTPFGTQVELEDDDGMALQWRTG